ncbi:MAG: hypothetical protein AMJ90_02660 [candidate division Zixibacteria bacterium SM23_73_2]|nr:MAG: hypothetical protein AMJ90_02660 [candidate division Zixibacteria bacterium SM23_73_2]
MIELLRDVKSVRGVGGILFLDRKEKKSFQIFPKLFEPEVVKGLFLLLLKLTENMEGGGKIEFKFQEGKAFIFNLPFGALFVYGRMSLNLDLLELMVKAFISKIEKGKIKGTFLKSSDFTSQFYLKILIRATNLASESYQKVLGTYIATQNLRLAKDSIIDDYPFLKKVFVNNAGEISLLNQEKISWEKKTMEGFARWVFQFRKFCSILSEKIKTQNIEELTSELKDNLEEIGFYEVYRSLQK